MSYRGEVKRLLDLVLSLAALTLLLPLLLISAALIKLTSQGPVLFVQSRVGQGGGVFRIYKLRTMYVGDRDWRHQTSSGDSDVTRVGAILRRLKIDELPQIFNVLYGDMSIVGPRPCQEQTAAEMPVWARRRFEVRPGMTGLAQVHGNAALPWEARWKYDVKYIDACNFALDLWIIGRTMCVLALGEDRFQGKT
jgi:undecaprenyl phosphate N,N'-diacetylbacillosamine 1-phosphate transferase